jgi:hypothetical protein
MSCHWRPRLAIGICHPLGKDRSAAGTHNTIVASEPEPALAVAIGASSATFHPS